MSKLILKDSGEPFASENAAKAKRTRMGEEGLGTNIVEIEGGYALERKPENRRGKRIPIGTRQRLSIDKRDKDPNREYRIVNNDEGRIEMFEEAGWRIERKKIPIGDQRIEDGTQMGSAVTKPVGQKKIGVLMSIEKKLYKEDQDAKSDKIKESMRAIARETEKPGQYGNIKIERQISR